MKTLRLTFLILTMTFSSLSFAKHAEIAAEVVKIKTPEIYLSAANRDNTEMFMEVKNNGKRQHTIIAATSPIAEEIQLHTYIKRNGKVYMRKIKNISIPTHKETDLKPNGFHIMLINLKQKLRVGQIVPVTIIFKDGSHLSVNPEIERS